MNSGPGNAVARPEKVTRDADGAFRPSETQWASLKLASVRAFGAELYQKRMADDGQRVLHAALGVFGTMIMLSDEFPEYDPDMKSPPTLGGTTFALHVDFDAPDKVNAILRAWLPHLLSPEAQPEGRG